MYDFDYNCDVNLFFTDTDSLIYENKSEDVYEKNFKHKYLFDFRNCSKVL